MIKYLQKDIKYLLFFVSIFLFLSITGNKYGLPDENRIMPYNPDEITWIEALSSVKGSKLKYLLLDFGGTPPFFGYIYGVSLKTLSFFNIIKLVNDKNYYFKNINEWRKFFITGRSLQIVFGVFSIFMIFLIGVLVFNRKVAIISSFFYSFIPGSIGTAHFMQANLLVSLLTLITFLLFIIIIKNENIKDNIKLYVFAGIFCGISIATKYSALPLVFLLFLTSILFDDNKKNIFNKKLLISILSIGLTLLFFIPKIIVEPKIFINSVIYISNGIKVIKTINLNLIQKILLPFIYSMHYSLGPILLVLCILGIILSILKFKIQNKSKKLLIIWIIIFYLIMIQITTGNSIARLLIITPFYIFFGADLIDKLLLKNKVTGIFLISLIIISTGFYTLLLELHYLNLTNQKKASDWIRSNVSKKEKIGIYRTYWWTPDNIYKTKNSLNPYEVMEIMYDSSSVDKVDFVVISLPEIFLMAENEEKFTSFNNLNFINELNKKFKVVKKFTKQVKFLSLLIPLPESRLFLNDIMWSPTIIIYKRFKT